MTPQLLIAVAMLCQVTGTNANNYSGVTVYSLAHKMQQDCQKQLLTCMGTGSSENKLSLKLQKCILDK